MGVAFLHGNGGGGIGGLNFDVKVYTSENNLPSTAKENSIAAITASGSTSWVFSFIEPSDTSVIWFKIGTESSISFNMLKKNAIYVYPISCNAHNGEKWHTIESWIYKSSGWVKFSELVTATYLYQPGDTCDELTGGYKLVGITNDAPTIDYGETSMVIYAARHPQVGSYKKSIAYTTNQIDLTDLNTLTLEGTVEGLGAGWSKAKMCVWSASPTYDNHVKSYELSNGSEPVTVDVSDLSGGHYIGFTFDCTNVQIYITVNELRLE